VLLGVGASKEMFISFLELRCEGTGRLSEMNSNGRNEITGFE